MINALSVEAVASAHFDEGMCRPLYDTYGFSRIPATVHAYLTGKKRNLALPPDVGGLDETADFVVMFFIDSFGWRFFEQYLPQAPFLQRFAEGGISSKLTSQFPSTTTAHVTCMNTGLNVGQSGLYEWFTYEPSLDRVISPLLCSFAGDKEPGTIEKAGVDTATLYPAHTLYQDFEKEGIRSFALQPHIIAHSPYSEAMFRGSTYIPFQNNSDALDKALGLYYDKPIGEKRYVYVYLSDLDSVAHRHGPSSHEYAQAVMQLMTIMEERFFQKLKARRDVKAVALVTADHGMIEISPENTLYLNKQLPSFERYIARNKRGDLLVPAGTCRDFFLHLLPETLGEAQKVLEDWLGDRAWVVKTEELIEKGFFGSERPSKNLTDRIGNLVIIPRGHLAVWWYEKDRFEQRFYGMHGGLSVQEMEIPFLFQKL